jgi:hypothetical protein
MQPPIAEKCNGRHNDGRQAETENWIVKRSFHGRI